MISDVMWLFLVFVTCSKCVAWSCKWIPGIPPVPLRDEYCNNNHVFSTCIMTDWYYSLPYAHNLITYCLLALVVIIV